MLTSASRLPGNGGRSGGYSVNQLETRPLMRPAVDTVRFWHSRNLSDPRGKLAATTTEGRAPCAGNATNPIAPSRTTSTRCARRFARTAGWCSTSRATAPPFAYTIGLHDWGLSELLITAVSPQRATRLLNAVARDAVTGSTLTPGQ